MVNPIPRRVKYNPFKRNVIHEQPATIPTSGTPFPRSEANPLSSPGDMSAFVRAVKLGGFSMAARELGLTPSAISKLVTRL